jgi:outer membrane protein assembly factor BamA
MIKKRRQSVISYLLTLLAGQIVRYSQLSPAFLLLIAASIATAQPFPNCNTTFTPAASDYPFVRDREPVALPDGEYFIDTIEVTRLPVFSEIIRAENNRLYRWANRFHFLTREPIVSQQLLFAKDEKFEPRLLQESQRLLRAQGYFFDADIRPYRVCGDKVDVEVITRDSWSFTPDLGFDRSGGENSFSLGMRDTNIFGLGNELKITSSNDFDRRSSEIVYGDNNLFGTRLRNRTEFVSSDDGSAASFDIGLPFFELDSRTSWRLLLETDERIDELFFRGEEIAGVVHDRTEYSVEYGISNGLVHGHSRRLSAGVGYRQDEFAQAELLPPPTQFPLDRTLSYPFLRYESLEDKFVTAFNLNQIYLTEDLLVGSQTTATLGFASELFGSDVDRLVLAASYSDTLLYDGARLWQHKIWFDGFWNRDRGELEDFVVNYESRYFQRQSERLALFASIEAGYSKNLNPNRQLFMGGFAGARAFDNRFQAGDRSVVATIEERLYTDIHVFNLVRVGAALFVDVGRAWQPGVDDGLKNDYLANFGIGLRLASSKAASSRIAHIDLATPLTNRNDPSVSGVQLSIEVKGSF